MRDFKDKCRVVGTKAVRLMVLIVFLSLLWEPLVFAPPLPGGNYGDIKLEGTTEAPEEDLPEVVTFTVNSLNDTVDRDLEDSVCADADGDCTLRAAIGQMEKMGATGRRIVFAEGLTGPIILGALGELVISKTMTITGPGAEMLTLDANEVGRVLTVDLVSAGTVKISGLTFTGGNTKDGGGIRVNADATLELSSSIVTGNTATAYGGGIAIETDGAVILSNSTVSNNPAGLVGGGIFVIGDLTVKDSTISGNSANVYGGGMGIGMAAGTVELSNVTISGNTANADGGGVHMIASDLASVLALNNVTIIGNAADDDGEFQPGDGGGIYLKSNSEHFSLRNSIIAGNEDKSPGAEAPNCFGTIPASFSVIGDATGCAVLEAVLVGIESDALKLDPRLLDNGGPSKTHALIFDSPAIDAGDDASCVANDQRGLARLGKCDIGAYEYTCGNSTVEAAVEECDDGNTADDDGCSSTCQNEVVAAGGGGVTPPAAETVPTEAAGKVAPEEGEGTIIAEIIEKRSDPTPSTDDTGGGAPADDSGGGGCTLIR